MDPDVAASRFVDADGVKHIDLSLMNKKPRKIKTHFKQNELLE